LCHAERYIEEKRGKAICIQASDDVMVAGMPVMVSNEKGTVVERG
jgi:hypothetical protein